MRVGVFMSSTLIIDFNKFVWAQSKLQPNIHSYCNQHALLDDDANEEKYFSHDLFDSLRNELSY